jgi:hypothetical protein
MVLVLQNKITCGYIDSAVMGKIEEHIVNLWANPFHSAGKTWYDTGNTGRID